jgi:uncharacterized delta-60 repeat protein
MIFINYHKTGNKLKEIIMKKIHIAILLTILLSEVTFSQVSLEWSKIYNGPKDSFDVANSIALDLSGNVYVAGGSTGINTGPDFTVIKYNPSGTQQWINRYTVSSTGWGRDYAKVIKVDISGNIIVGGWIATSTMSDMAVFKYTPSGDLIWIRTYNGTGSGDDQIYGMTLDNNGNIYVTGPSDGSPYVDFATIKYDSSGNQMWVQRWNGPTNESDVSNSIAVDASGNIYVTGTSLRTATTSGDFMTIKYNQNGVLQWERRFNYVSNLYDAGRFILLDSSGNVYVTGYSTDGASANSNYTTIKYSSSGDSLWIKFYDGGGQFDQPYGMKVTANGTVIVTGMSASGGTTGMDFATVCYNSDGTQRWVNRYNFASGIGPLDNAQAIELTPDGNVVVTGNSAGNGTNHDYATIKYNLTTGAQTWVNRWNGPATGYDIPLAIAVDQAGNVYASGQCNGPTATYDIGTIKLSGTTGIKISKNELPKEFHLYQNYPNPFNPETVIKFALPKGGITKLTIYSINGKEIDVLLNRNLNKGSYEVKWNADKYSNGIYFYMLETGGYRETKKMILLK